MSKTTAKASVDDTARFTYKTLQPEESSVTLSHHTGSSEQSDPYLGVELANRFHIDALIGRGGMSAVYRATDPVLGRTVAIKIMRCDLDEENSLRLRFMREARAAARIAHPNVLLVYDFGFTPQGSIFLVMEFIEGITMRSLLRQHLRLSIAWAVDLMRQLASAVDAAHQAGVIHRDLKPENIILKDTGDGRVLLKLIDLGIVKLKESINHAPDRITDKTGLVGTPAYMSPEQCMTSKIDELSDIYSLGIIFYELLIGDTPFNGSTAAVMRKHHYAPVPGLCERRSEIPYALERLVMLMLSKNKEDRPRLKEILQFFDEFKVEEIATETQSK